MAPEGQDRGDGFDDLFEELDNFFAPGGQAERARRRRGGEPADAEQPPGEAGEGGGAEDLLPAGWKPDIESLDLAATEVPDPARPKERKRRGRGERAEEPPPNAEEPPPNAEEPPPNAEEPPPNAEEPPPKAEEPTGEMTSEDWTRLRDALGEEP